MDIQQARDLILTLRKESGVYAMLDAGWRYVAAVPEDLEIAELVLEALLEVGLGGVARELLQARRDLDPQRVEEWRRRVGEAPAGRISWAQMENTYHSNLSLLVQHQPHLAGIEPELDRALRGLHLYQTSAGHYLFSKREAGKYREWLPAITDHAHDVKMELPKLPHGTPIFIDGISLGPMVERVFAATASIGLNQSLPVFLVDEELSHLAAWLHLADRSKLLGDERVFVFCGPQALEMLEQLLDEQEELAWAPGCVITPPGFKPLTAELEAIQLRVQQRREETFSDVMAQLRLRYAERDLDYWRRRLQDKGPILAMTSRATTMLQYSTRDIGHAVEELGYEFHLLIESADHCQLSGLRIARMMLEIDPILFVQIDHLRYEQKDLLFDIPMLTWVQDPLPNLLNARAGASIGPLDFVCGYYRGRCVEEFGYPLKQFFDAPFPVSTRIFHGGSIPARDRENLACDMVYVGHMQDTVDTHFERWQKQSSAVWQPVLQTTYERVMDTLRRGDHIIEPAPFLRTIIDELGIRLEDNAFEKIAYHYCHRLFDLGYRQQTLGWVGEWAGRTGRRFRIYGRGWENHAELARYAAGPIEHGEPLRRVYRGARLALQTIPSGFQHQRTFEALASGLLVLARYSPNSFGGGSIQQFKRRQQGGEDMYTAAAFFPGLDRVVFRSAAEFERLADRYLADTSAYDTVLAELREIVLNKYSYRTVLAGVLDKIKDYLSPQVPAVAAS